MAGAFVRLAIFHWEFCMSNLFRFIEKEGLVTVKAFFQLAELQGIKLGFEDSKLLEKQCRDKPGSQNIRYKEAL